MKFNKESKLITLFIFFCLVLISSFAYVNYQKTLLPKIVLESKTNPLEVIKPEPKNSNLSLNEVRNLLIKMELQNDKKLEVDDIE